MADGMAADLYGGALIWDAHAGFELNGEGDLETLSVWKAAGIGFLSVNVGYDVGGWQATIRALALARRWIAASDDYALVGTVAGIEQARAAGRMAVAFDIEGMDALAGSVDMVRLYYDLGVRQMLFAYNRNNAAGGGCHDEDTGLTPFGRAALAEMNRVGMLVDCSHCAYRTTMEAMERSAAPVIFSHSNARALRDHQRNILDEQARACAATGGVVGVNGINLFVGEDDISPAGMADHIAHYAERIGPEHVGIGLDYFVPVPPGGAGPGLGATMQRNAAYWPAVQYPRQVRCAAPDRIIDIAEEMLRRGFTEVAVRGVLGGNFRRVAAQVWR